MMADNAEQSYIVVYQSPGTIDRGLLKSHGHTITSDLGDASVLVVKSKNRADLASLPGVEGVALDRPRMSIPRDTVIEQVPAPNGPLMGCASTTASCPLQWDLARIHLPDAWKTTQGSPSVTVAVLDTGLRSTHQEVGPNYDIANSKSFVEPNDFCPLDNTTFSSIEDFNGHGAACGRQERALDDRYRTTHEAHQRACAGRLRIRIL